MKTKEAFQDYFIKNMQPGLAALDANRIKTEHNRSKFLFIAVPIGILIALLAFPVHPYAFLIVLFLEFFFGRIILNALTGDFYDQFKLQLITKIVYFFSPNLTYTPKAHIDKSEYAFSNLFFGGEDRFNGEDLILGSILLDETTNSRVDIKMSELHAEERHHGSKGRTYYTTVFKGVFIIAKFNKTFKSDTYVFNDSGILNKLSGKWGTKQVKLEDPEFESEFEVYSNDQIEARYILTPDFMETLLKFKRDNGTNIRVSFRNNQMFIAIPDSASTLAPNMFEPNYSDSLLDVNCATKYYSQMNFYFQLLESLKLDAHMYL